MSGYDPTDTADDTHAKYRFFPTVRRGYRPADPFPGAKTDSGEKPYLPASGDVDVAVDLRASKGPGDRKTVTKGLEMYGPEHVTGIDGSQVVRMEPSPGTGTFPPNYFPLVEFDTPDLPWVFSPVDHDADGRTYPWFTLAVVEKGNDDVSVSVDTKSPNPVLEAPAAQLPVVEECWAWAHAQVVGSPHKKQAANGSDTSETDPLKREFEQESNITVSRLIGSRNLKPSTDYVAAVVPTFEAGRLVGLGEDPPDESGGQQSTPKERLAWKTGGGSTVKLPVYHHWEFTTAERGDFEYLVRKLESRRLSNPEYDIGSRPVDVTDPGPESLDFDDGNRHTASVGGALQASPPGDWWYERGHELRDLLNKPERVAAQTGWQVVGPPIYGKWHALVDSLFDLRTDGAPYDGYGRDKPALAARNEQDLQWVHDLNLSPGFRLAAAVGADVVQGQQEKLMTAAWDQVGGIREANRLLGAAQLSRAALATTYERLADPNYPRDRLLQYTAPAHERLYLDQYGQTASAHIGESSLGSAIFSPAFRRLTSGAGRLASRLEDPSVLDTVATALVDGRVSTDHGTGPGGMDRADTGGNSVGDLCGVGQWLSPPPEERPDPREDDRERDEPDRGGDTDRQQIVTDAIVQLEAMLDTCGRIDDDLDGILSLVDGGLDASDRQAVTTLEADALSKWDALNGRVTNFHRVVSTIARRSDELPTVSPEFDSEKRIELYGDQSGQHQTLGDMTRPFSETFLTESRFPSFWLGLGPTQFPSLTDVRRQPLRDVQGIEGDVLDPAVESRLDGVQPGDRLDSDADRSGGGQDTDGDHSGGGQGGGGQDGGGQGGGGQDGDGQGGGQNEEGQGGRSGAHSGAAMDVPNVMRAKSLVGDVELAIERILSYFGVSDGDDGMYLERLFCGTTDEQPDEYDPDLKGVVEAYSPVESFEDRVLERLDEPSLGHRPDPLDTVMAYPEFTTPMYRDLKEESEEYMLPGVDNVPKETVGALVTNPAFIEAFMVGLNHEMASELLWRRYPTDRRGSYFKRFWNQESRIPKPEAPEKMDDVLPLHRWEDKGPDGEAPSPLGSNTRTGERDSEQPKTERNPGKVSTQVVLLVRGELLERYPNTDIYAAKAHTKGGDRVPRWASPETKQDEADTDVQKFPVFRGQLDPDITFFGFDLTPAQARAGGANDDGWFFVLSEPPTETRFGLDIGQDDETSPPFGVVEGSGSPTNVASEAQVDEGVESGWSGLSWKHLGDESSPYLSVEETTPGKDNWKTEHDDTWAAQAAWTETGDETDPSESAFTFGHEGAAEWGRNSAHMAYITWQKPVRVAIHADDILARARDPSGGGS